MAATVRIIKLITGEDILTEVKSEFADPLRIKNPVRIVVMPNKMDPKTPNIGFAPWAEFSDDKEFTLDKTHIVAIMTPIKEFVNQYNSMFGGLVVPSSNLILPGQ
jgi:hypothetical protein